MALTSEDQSALERQGFPWVIHEDGGMTCVEISNFRLPDGYTQPSATLLLRLNPAFPDVPPDMWWFNPPALRRDGVAIKATEHTEQHLGRSWQRWSRHLQPTQWQSGVDSMESFLAIIRRELADSVSPVAACA